MTDCWTRLKIAPTTDKKAIQKAYREELRHCHPETDPEGFSLLRQCYEAALDNAKQASTTPSPEPQTPLDVQVASTTPATLVSTPPTRTKQLTEQFTATLQSAHWWNVADQWHPWFAQYRQCSISEQLALSQQALQTLLDNRWLPSPIVLYFYEQFEWQQLQYGNHQEKQLSEFLESWVTEAFPLPPTIFAPLSFAEQRGLLTVLNPLVQGLHYHHLPAIHYFVMQPTPFSILASCQTAIVFLRALRAVEIWHQDWIVPIIDGLLTHHTEQLQDDDLALCCELVRHCHHDALFARLVALLETRGAYALLYDELQAFLTPVDKSLSVCFAVLAQETHPQPAGLWKLSESLEAFFLPEQPPIALHWLTTLLAQDAYPVELPLTFDRQHNVYDCFAFGYWLGRFGAWQAIRAFLATLPERTRDMTAYQQLLFRHLTTWLNHKLTDCPLNDALINRFAQYGQDDWFTSDGFTTEYLPDTEVASLSVEQWCDTYIRHPIIPHTWVKQLYQAKKLELDRLRSDCIPSFIEHLFCNQRQTGEFDYLATWQPSTFTGCFNWTWALVSRFTYGFDMPLDPDYHELLPLPDSLQPTVLGQLAPWIQSPQALYASTSNTVADLPVCPISGYLTFLYVEHHYPLTEARVCAEQALQDDPVYALMLVDILMDRDGDEAMDDAIVAYAIAKSFESAYPNLSISNTCFYSTLQSRHHQQGRDQDTYNMTRPEVLSLYLNEDNADMLEFDRLNALSAEDDAKQYHYPISLMLSYIHHGSQQNRIPSNLNIRRLTEPDTPHSDTKTQLAQIAVHRMESKVREKLVADIHARGKKIATYSKPQLAYLGLINLIVLWFAMDGFQLLNMTNTSAQITVGISLFAQWGLTAKLGALTGTRKRFVIYFAVFSIPIIASLLTHSTLWCWIGLAMQLFYILVIPSCNMCGRWSKKAYQRGENITIADF